MTSGPLEWVIAALPLALFVPLFVRAALRLPPEERALVSAAVALHVVAAVAMVLITREVYGYGDMLKYHRVGAMLAARARNDVALFGEVVRLVLQRQSAFDFVDGAGTATGTMHGLAALACLALFDSLPAACVAIALASAGAKLALYDTFRTRVHASHRRLLFIAIVLVPSYVFWSSGLLKEGFAITGLGWLVWSLAPVVGICGTSSFVRLVPAPFAAVLIGLTKPYLLFPVALGMTAAWVVSRRAGWFSPLRLGLALFIAIALVSVLSSLFPRYATEVVATAVARPSRR
jgi:hypothetical protein